MKNKDAEKIIRGRIKWLEKQIKRKDISEYARANLEARLHWLRIDLWTEFPSKKNDNIILRRKNER